MAADALAIVGLIRNAQGIRGEVVIEPLTDAPDAVLASGRRVFVGDDPMNVESARPFKGGVMVKFSQVADRNAAELLRGKYVFSPFDELAPPRDDERTYHVNSDKITRQLGFTMKREIRDAVADIIRAFDRGFWKNPDDPIYHNIKVMRAREHADS